MPKRKTKINKKSQKKKIKQNKRQKTSQLVKNVKWNKVLVPGMYDSIEIKIIYIFPFLWRFLLLVSWVYKSTKEKKKP